MKNTHIIINAENLSELEEFLKRSNIDYINRTQEEHEKRVELLKKHEEATKQLKKETFEKEKKEYEKMIWEYKIAMKKEPEIIEYFTAAWYTFLETKEEKKKETISMENEKNISDIKYNSYIIIKDEAILDREKIDIRELYYMYKLIDKKA